MEKVYWSLDIGYCGVELYYPIFTLFDSVLNDVIWLFIHCWLYPFDWPTQVSTLLSLAPTLSGWDRCDSVVVNPLFQSAPLPFRPRGLVCVHNPYWRRGIVPDYTKISKKTGKRRADGERLCFLKCSVLVIEYFMLMYFSKYIKRY